PRRRPGPAHGNRSATARGDRALSGRDRAGGREGFRDRPGDQPALARPLKAPVPLSHDGRRVRGLVCRILTAPGGPCHSLPHRTPKFNDALLLRRIDQRLAAGVTRFAWQVSYHMPNFRPAETTLGTLPPSARGASGPWRPQRHAEVLLQAGFRTT